MIDDKQHAQDVRFVTWAWRLAMLASALWIGYELHTINRRMPTGTDYETEQRIDQISSSVREINQKLQAVELNTRR